MSLLIVFSFGIRDATLSKSTNKSVNIGVSDTFKSVSNTFFLESDGMVIIFVIFNKLTTLVSLYVDVLHLTNFISHLTHDDRFHALLDIYESYHLMF
jgi:hypothetical protein